MYSKTVEIKEGRFILHHNSDFSGEVIITKPSDNNWKDIRLPGELLLILGRATFITMARNKLVSYAENFDV